MQHENNDADGDGAMGAVGGNDMPVRALLLIGV